MLAQETETLLIPSDVANLLGVHPSAIIRWMTRGTLLRNGTRLRLQHIKLPGSYRIKRQWLDEYLEALATDRQGADDAPAPKPTRRSQHSALVNAELAAAGF